MGGVFWGISTGSCIAPALFAHTASLALLKPPRCARAANIAPSYHRRCLAKGCSHSHTLHVLPQARTNDHQWFGEKRLVGKAADSSSCAGRASVDVGPPLSSGQPPETPVSGKRAGGCQLVGARQATLSALAHPCSCLARREPRRHRCSSATGPLVSRVGTMPGTC